MSAKPSHLGRKWPLALIEEIGRAWRKGESAGLIAERLGVTRNQIIGLMWRNGYERRPTVVQRTQKADPARQSAAARRSWADPEIRERRIAAIKAGWARKLGKAAS